MDVNKRQKKRQLLEDKKRFEYVYNTALTVLLECNIHTLPIELSDITEHYDIAIFKNSDFPFLQEGEEGVNFIRGQQKVIVYDESQRKTRTRFTVAHELGHILLGHPPLCSRSNAGKASRAAEEQEADRFAAALLAPDCVLWGTGCSMANNIAILCNISKAFSEHKETTYRYLMGQGKLLKTELEVDVYSNFLPFINDYRSKK